jgi:hypothetical protein
MPELIQTLKSMKEREASERKFLASLKGIDLGVEEGSNEGSSFDDVRRRAYGITASGDDIKSLQGQFASEAGFGIGMGLGYIEE